LSVRCGHEGYSGADEASWVMLEAL
jgi:hypothetical protein